MILMQTRWVHEEAPNVVLVFTHSLLPCTLQLEVHLYLIVYCESRESSRNYNVFYFVGHCLDILFLCKSVEPDGNTLNHSIDLMASDTSSSEACPTHIHQLHQYEIFLHNGIQKISIVEDVKTRKELSWHGHVQKYNREAPEMRTSI